MTKKEKIGKKMKIKKSPKKIETKEMLKNTINKSKKITRVSSGIKNFDSLSEGGFEKNSTNLMVGESGSGKTIFAMQFLIDGIRKGENCLFITFEEKKEGFYKNMFELGFDLEKLENQGKFFFLEYTPQKVKTMLDEGGGEIESTVLNKKISRIVIDSITSFVMLFEDELERKEAALSLFSLLRGWDCTSLLTYDGKPNADKKASRILDLEADSITLLYFKRGKKERKRYLEIFKMRGTNHSLSLHSFEIGKGGLNLNKKLVSELSSD